MPALTPVLFEPGQQPPHGSAPPAVFAALEQLPLPDPAEVVVVVVVVDRVVDVEVLEVGRVVVVVVGLVVVRGVVAVEVEVLGRVVVVAVVVRVELAAVLEGVELGLNSTST